MKPSHPNFNEIREAALAKLLAIYQTQGESNADVFNELIDVVIADDPDLDVDVDDLTFYVGYSFEEDCEFFSQVWYTDDDEPLMMLPMDYDFSKQHEPSMALRKATGRCV